MALIETVIALASSCGGVGVMVLAIVAITTTGIKDTAARNSEYAKTKGQLLGLAFCDASTDTSVLPLIRRAGVVWAVSVLSPALQTGRRRGGSSNPATPVQGTCYLDSTGIWSRPMADGLQRVCSFPASWNNEPEQIR